mmetsp:Transcript_1549/g.3420  ORF Transcript_1549/g.3420 Transcript_1549/m.3420 type:complete len:85 (-) Transcript_1549:31-285(-)
MFFDLTLYEKSKSSRCCWTTNELWSSDVSDLLDEPMQWCIGRGDHAGYSLKGYIQAAVFLMSQSWKVSFWYLYQSKQYSLIRNK